MAALVLASAAAAEVRSGSATDPVDGLPPGQDIVAVSVSYDTAGTLTAAVTTVAAPQATEEMGLGLAFGSLQGSECFTPAATLTGLYWEPTSGAWSYGGSNGVAQKNVSGSTTTLTATSAALAGQPFNCADAAIYDLAGEEPVLIEELAAAIQLVGPPPAPTPAPVPAPPAPPAAPPAPKKVAALSLAGLPTLTLHRNSWKKVKVQVSNPGTATAGKVSLKVGRAPGVVVKPKSGKLELKPIAAGKSKLASFKIRLTKKAKPTSALALEVTGAKGLEATGTLTVKAWKKPGGKKGKGKGKKPPVPATPPLAEKIFYRYELQSMESAKLLGFAFIDGTWAYQGIPAGGLPTCTAVTGSAEKEGCVKYSYDPKSGAVQIESIGSGKIGADGKLEIGGETYSPTSIPAAGTKLQVEQEYIGYTGLCGPFSSCTTWHEHLLFANSGEFVLSRESLSTLEGAGTFVAAGSYPPDQHGTYVIEPRARIKLTFADGTAQTKTIAIFLNKEGKPDPFYEGLMLDATYFTFAHDET